MEQIINFDSQHVQMGGMAHYDQCKFFQFCPDECGVGAVPGFRSAGVAQQLPDGTFAFQAQPKRKSQSTLLKKVAHGRLSVTKDGCYQLTLKIAKSEGLCIKDTLFHEVVEATSCLEETR